MVNIYQMLHLAFPDWGQERETHFHFLQTVMKEWEFQPCSSSVPTARPYTSDLSHSPSFWDSNWDLPPLPTIHVHKVWCTPVSFSPLSNSAERDKGKKSHLFKKKKNGLKQKKEREFFPLCRSQKPVKKPEDYIQCQKGWYTSKSCVEKSCIKLFLLEGTSKII